MSSLNIVFICVVSAWLFWRIFCIKITGDVAQLWWGSQTKPAHNSDPVSGDGCPWWLEKRGVGAKYRQGNNDLSCKTQDMGMVFGAPSLAEFNFAPLTRDGQVYAWEVILHELLIHSPNTLFRALIPRFRTGSDPQPKDSCVCVCVRACVCVCRSDYVFWKCNSAWQLLPLVLTTLFEAQIRKNTGEKSAAAR